MTHKTEVFRGDPLNSTFRNPLINSLIRSIWDLFEGSFKDSFTPLLWMSFKDSFYNLLCDSLRDSDKVIKP